MKRHKKNIVAVALIALAGGALIVDRFVLGYGGPQVAGAETMADLLATASKPAATSGGTGAASVQSVSDRIAGLGVRVASLPYPPTPESTDAFVIPAVWRTDIAESTPVSGSDSPASSPASAPKAETVNLTLTAVVAGATPESSAATINGRVVKVGRSISGYTLLRVNGSSAPTAVLQGPNGEITLHTKLEETLRAAQDRGDAEPMIKPHRSE